MNRLDLVVASLSMAALCGCSPMGEQVDLLDFGNAYYYVAENPWNNLFIEIESRMKLSTGAEYWLLAPHPRESTFANNGAVYTSKLAEDGPSDIVFMIGRGNVDTALARRYLNPAGREQFLHECTPAPYGEEVRFTPAALSSRSIRELGGTSDLQEYALEAGRKVYAVVEYEVDGVSVTTDFPVKLINGSGNPDAERGREWQAASPMVPLYVPSEGEGCKAIRNGYVAFSDLGSATLQFVYLCYDPKAGTQDYSCTVNYNGNVKLFARR